MTPLIITAGKRYTTRDGREARVYATDGGTQYPVHGAVWNGTEWTMAQWTKEGRFGFDERERSRDLTGDWCNSLVQRPQPEGGE